MAQERATIRTRGRWECLPCHGGEEISAWGQGAQQGHCCKCPREGVVMSEGLPWDTRHPNTLLLDVHRKERVAS